MDRRPEGPTLALFRDQPAEGWPSMERYADGLQAGLEALNLGWRLRPLVPPPPWPLPYGLLLRRLLHYPLWARRRQGDVNHVIDHSYGHLLFGLDPSRTVVTIHDVAPLLFPGRRLGLSGLAWRWAWRGTLRAARWIADSRFTREAILAQIEYPPDRCVVVPLGVEPRFRVLPPEQVEARLRGLPLPEGPFLLHVGHLHPRKNFEGLLDALGRLVRRGERLPLVQVGGTPSPAQRARLEALGLGDQVRFLGRVEDEVLVALYNRAALFVFPSLYEGFGLPVLEAMACGTPVVAADATSLPEVVGDAGLLVDPRDPETLAEALIRLWRDRELAAELRERGLARARAFTWEETARRTVEVYRALLEG